MIVIYVPERATYVDFFPGGWRFVMIHTEPPIEDFSLENVCQYSRHLMHSIGYAGHVHVLLVVPINRMLIYLRESSLLANRVYTGAETLCASITSSRPVWLILPRRQ